MNTASICDICGRPFGNASLAIHRAQCEKKRARELQEAEAQRKHDNRPMRPMPGGFCYICSKPYGKASLPSHEKSCMERWERENNELPKGQRRPRPVKPETLMNEMRGGGGGGGGADLGSAAVGGSGQYQVDDAAYAEACLQASKMNMAECQNCGRRFNPDRLQAHQRSCRPGKPAKRVGEK